MTTNDITASVEILLSVWGLIVMFAFGIAVTINLLLALPWWGAFLVSFSIFFALNYLRKPMIRAFVTAGS